MSQEEIWRCVELLDIDESMTDTRLKIIMNRKTQTEKQLSNAALLLSYKLVINEQEQEDCENDEELEFAAKLMQQVDVENVSSVCKIVSLVLNLHRSTLVGKAEHFLQQILSSLFSDPGDDKETSRELLLLKICNSILDTVIENGMQVSLLFLEVPIDKILLSTDDNLKNCFLTLTVPKMIYGVEGYDVVDKILALVLREFKDDQIYETLKVLSCLADYYLPMAEEGVERQEPSQYEGEFWKVVMDGMNSADANQRKIALYLAKRGVEFNVTNNACPFLEYNEKYKNNWDDFFVLMESLEEKQSNIVLPSLQFFESLEQNMSKWLNIAYNIGLKHENNQVKKRCIELKLKVKIESAHEAQKLLEAMNDINLFANTKEADNIISNLKKALGLDENIVHFLKAFTRVQWSPVPLYYVTSALDLSTSTEDFINKNKDVIIKSIIDIIKLQCNNIVIKQYTEIKMLELLRQISKQIHWKIVLNILLMVQLILLEHDYSNKYTPDLNKIDVNEDEKIEFFDYLTSSPHLVKLALSYFNSVNRKDIFLAIVNQKIKKINDINTRQYSNKMDCFNDYIYLAHLYDKTICAERESAESEINAVIQENVIVLVNYLLNILSDDVAMTVDDPKNLQVATKFILVLDDIDIKRYQDIKKNIYKSAMLILNDTTNNDLVRKVLCLRTLEVLVEQHTKIKFEDYISILKLRLLTKEMNKSLNSSKLKDEFYEVTAKLIFLLPHTFEERRNIKDLIEYIEHNIECGNGNCLTWILGVAAQNLDKLKSSGFNIKNFIERTWREMQDIKGTKVYEYCVGEFTNILLHEALIGDPEYNNVLLVYFNKIVDLGRSNGSFDPLYSFVCSLNDKRITIDDGLLVHFLKELLFFAPVVKKELRITESIASEINKTYFSGFGGNLSFSIHSVQELTLTILLKITDKRVHKEILNFIMKRIDETFKNRDRYHADSQPHKTLLIGIQHMLFYALLETNLLVKTNVDWCVNLLRKMPHQPSVRVCLEWYIALYICSKNLPLNENTVKDLNLNSLPPTSQQFILYHAINHRIQCEMYKTEEYDFVIKFLLEQTMGPNFSVRLNAQYLALNTYRNARPEPDIHKYTMNIVEKTLQESNKEKAYIKLQKDIFANKFDVICNLTPYFIYNFVPKYFGLVLLGQSSNILPSIEECKRYIENNPNDILKPWMLYCLTNFEIDESKIEMIEETSDVLAEEISGSIQKKYIPWRNMGDIGYGDNLVKKETSGDLIVVASLVDKLPNLGGLARTSEVFGVRTFVVPSLAKLKDPQFQGLSVSAERWVDIQEVRPGQALKEYLMMKKGEGYSLVAAEQTSNSVPLQGFKFPKRTVLVLGHEKSGISCDLLPLMDSCVEVPQSGLVRSLNVHVTAAIFVWEYTRQNVL